MTEMYSGIDFQSEFRNYAIKHMGVSGMEFYAWEQMQNQIYGMESVLGRPNSIRSNRSLLCFRKPKATDLTPYKWVFS